MSTKIDKHDSPANLCLLNPIQDMSTILKFLYEILQYYSGGQKTF